MSVVTFTTPVALTPSVASGLAILALVIISQSVIYPLFISRLRHIPGPKIAAITSLHIDSHYYNDTAIPYVKSLFEKHGPIVRVGPNEVVVNDPTIISLIYGVRSTFQKPPTAILSQNYGFPNMFSSITREEHKQNRKPVSKIYTANAILNNRSLAKCIQDRLDAVFTIIDRNQGNAVDIFAVAGCFALDVVSFLVYGKSFKSLDGENLEMGESIRHLSSASLRFLRFAWLFGYFTTWPLTLFLPQSVKVMISSVAYMEATSQEQITAANSRQCKPDPDTTVLGHMQAELSKSKSLTNGQIKSECLDHIQAGADTTAASITYLLYTLALPENRRYQDKLREEISKLSSPLDFKEVCHLSHLNNCILECLRLYPPGPGGLQQRATPAKENTILSSNGKKYTLPPGVLVGVQPYSLHRNEDVFGDDVDDFRPERWEEASEAHLRAMKDSWLVFGYGARTCLGMNLAMVELKVLVSQVLRSYTVELPGNSNASDMEPIYAVVIRPKAEKCDLIFRRISQE